MIYVPKDLIQFQSILHAFRHYIASSPYFDIVFTPKRGYIFLRLEKDFVDVTEIESPDELFEIFLHEISSDVRDLFLCGEHIDVDLYPAEIRESRRRILEYICHLPEGMQSHYTERMDHYFKHCND